ncbi:MAG: nucleotidyltransferase domain-containing protein [Candidatus Magasanikbacteria bacterium]|nr:nucleotidyltransferase domain-containing protein [Candidatus Magasanikbacteria bacterium]
MLTSQAVKAVHQALQAIFSDSVVLLGGSYWTGEATDTSDLDFYILRPFWHFFVYKWHLPAVEKLKRDHSGVTINCMVVPRFFYERGWYFVAGETVNGEIWQSPLNTKIVFRSAIKLTYWNYILFLTAAEPAEKQFALTKMAQHLTVARVVLTPAELPANGLTASFLIECLPTDQVWNPVRNLLLAKQTGQLFPVSELEAFSTGLFLLAERLFADNPGYWGFSWVNYIIYNSKFFRHKNTLFLFKNPDKMIVDCLREGLKNQTDLGRLREEMRTIIFPVIMI